MEPSVNKLSGLEIDEQWKVALPKELLIENGWKVGDGLPGFNINGDVTIMIPSKKGILRRED